MSKPLPDRHPNKDFFVPDGRDASPKDDMASMEHPLFSLATRPDRRILRYDHNGTRIEGVPSGTPKLIIGATTVGLAMITAPYSRIRPTNNCRPLM